MAMVLTSAGVRLSEGRWGDQSEASMQVTWSVRANERPSLKRRGETGLEGLEGDWRVQITKNRNKDALLGRPGRWLSRHLLKILTHVCFRYLIPNGKMSQRGFLLLPSRGVCSEKKYTQQKNILGCRQKKYTLNTINLILIYCFDLNDLQRIQRIW